MPKQNFVPAPPPSMTRCSECGVVLTEKNRAPDAVYYFMNTTEPVATAPLCKKCEKWLSEEPHDPPCFSCPEFEREVHCVPGEYTEYDANCNAGIGDLFDYTFMEGSMGPDDVCPYFELLKKVEEARWEGFNNAWTVMFDIVRGLDVKLKDTNEQS